METLHQYQVIEPCLRTGRRNQPLLLTWPAEEIDESSGDDGVLLENFQRDKTPPRRLDVLSTFPKERIVSGTLGPGWRKECVGGWKLKLNFIPLNYPLR